MLKRVRLWLLAAALLLAVPAVSFAGVFVSVTIAPPVLPVYAQPMCPGPGYIWTPGYWAYGPAGYYWVPGVWVIAPRPGLLWTPGYWAWDGVSYYVWHPGYWATTVGFYGGIVYGHGYYGSGYRGGYWRNGAFYYNRTVNNIDITRIHNTYNTTVIRNVTVNRVSYNGGRGGAVARPTAAERAHAQQPHYAATAVQQRHWDTARSAPSRHGPAIDRDRGSVAVPHEPREFHSRPGVQPGDNHGSGSRSELPRRPEGAYSERGSPHPYPQRQNPAGAMHERGMEQRGMERAPEHARAHGEPRGGEPRGHERRE